MQPISATLPMWRFSGVTRHLPMNVPPPRRIPDVRHPRLDPANREERIRVAIPRTRPGEPARAAGLVPEEVERG